MASLPRKLKDDAILEALVEVRFDSDDIPEIVLGKLADNPAWAKYRRNRLPISDLPTAIRISDEAFKYQPLFELRDDSEHCVVKIGTHAVSVHVLAPYKGWDVFRPHISNMLQVVQLKVSGVQYRRIGLRYINALRPELHHLASVTDLNLEVRVGGAALKTPFNLNFNRPPERGTECIVKVASPSFIQGPVPTSTIAFVDVDVYTPTTFRCDDAAESMKWIDDAHEVEKTAFFALLKEETIEKLREE